MNSAVTNTYGLLSRRIITILVKDHKLPVRQVPENEGTEAVIMKVILGFPPLPGAPTHQCGTCAGKAMSTTGLKCAVSGHSDYREPAAAPERRPTSLFYPGLYFSHGL